MNEVILQEIGEFCRQRGLAESTFGRRAVNDGKLASRLRNGGRITTDTLDRIRAFMARQAGAAPARRRMLFDPAAQTAMPPMKTPAPPPRIGPGRRRSAAQFPLLRQPAEISAVRQHLQREMGGRQPRQPRARQYPSAPAGGARVRRRRRRRHRADARDALDARPLSDHAVLHRRQGDQPRGRPPHFAEDGGPLHRTSFDGHRAHQSRLRRSAVADGEVGQRRRPAWSGKKWRSKATPRTRSSSRSPTLEAVSSARTGRLECRPRAATRSMSARWCWCSIATITNSCSIR